MLTAQGKGKSPVGRILSKNKHYRQVKSLVHAKGVIDFVMFLPFAKVGGL